MIEREIINDLNAHLQEWCDKWFKGVYVLTDSVEATKSEIDNVYNEDLCAYNTGRYNGNFEIRDMAFGQRQTYRTTLAVNFDVSYSNYSIGSCSGYYKVPRELAERLLKKFKQKFGEDGE